MMHNAIRDAIAAGTPDVKLNSMNWDNIAAAGTPTIAVQATGIDGPISIGVTPSAMGAWVYCTAYVGTSANLATARVYDLAQSVQSRFTLWPGMWMAFAADDGGVGASGTITVVNISDGNLLLDTINVVITP